MPRPTISNFAYCYGGLFRRQKPYCPASKNSTITDWQRFIRQDLARSAIRELKPRRRQRQRKRIISFVLLRDYFKSLNYRQKRRTIQEPNANRSGVQLKKINEKFTVVCLRSSKNLEFAHFTLFYAEDSDEMYQNVKRKCTAILAH